MRVGWTRRETESQGRYAIYEHLRRGITLVYINRNSTRPAAYTVHCGGIYLCRAADQFADMIDAMRWAEDAVRHEAMRRV